MMIKLSIPKNVAASIISDYALTLYNFVGLGHARSQGHVVGRSLLSIMKENGLKVQEYNVMVEDMKKILVDKLRVLRDFKAEKKDECTVVVELKDCFMLPVVEKLKAVGAETFTCPITSMLMTAVEELFAVGTEYRKFKTSNSKCEVVFGICK